MKQTKPFVVIITKKDKLNCEELSQMNKTDYGIFFDTSGKARIERVNPNASYTYLFKTVHFQGKYV